MRFEGQLITSFFIQLFQKIYYEITLHICKRIGKVSMKILIE